MSHPKISVLGAGSIGCYLGGRLIEGGAHVTLIGRERIRQDISRSGLTLSRFDEPKSTLHNVDFATSDEAVGGSDVIALCVKSQDTELAAKTINTHAPNAWIVAFQNGVSNLPLLRKTLGHDRISGAVVPFNVTSPSQGHFHQGTDGAFIIGPDAPEALTSALRASETPFRIEQNIDGFLWAKLLVNLNNALNTLWGGPLRDGLIQRDYRHVLIAMIEEGLGVAQAEGIDVATFNGRHPRDLIKLMRKPDWLYRFLMDRIAKIDRTARSSMLDDLDLGRQNELDYLQGEIVRLADLHGLDVPVNRAVMDATREAFAQKKTPRLSGAQMRSRFLGGG